MGGPVRSPTAWLQLVNQPQTEVAALRCCVHRGRPFGDPNWVTDTAKRLGLERTVRPRGRPKKQSQACHVYLYSLCSPDLILQIWWLSAFIFVSLASLTTGPLAFRIAPEEGSFDTHYGIQRHVLSAL